MRRSTSLRLAPAESAEPKHQALQHAAGFLRTQLSIRSRLRIIPELHFVYDDSVERGVRLSQLIDEAVAGDAERAADAEGDEA